MKEKEEEKGTEGEGDGEGEDGEGENEFLKMMCSTGSLDILKCIDKKGRAQYKDLKPFASTNTLNTRLRQLLSHGLIKHNITKTGKRKEWYELTEKGKNVLLYIRKMLDCVRKKGSRQIVNDEIISDNMQ